VFNSEELVGTTECLTLWSRFRKSRRLYKPVRLYYLCHSFEVLKSRTCIQQSVPQLLIIQSYNVRKGLVCRFCPPTELVSVPKYFICRLHYRNDWKDIFKLDMGKYPIKFVE